MLQLCFLLHISIGLVFALGHIDLKVLDRAQRVEGGWMIGLQSASPSSGPSSGVIFRERGLLQRRSGSLGVEGSVRETGWVALRQAHGEHWSSFLVSMNHRTQNRSFLHGPLCPCIYDAYLGPPPTLGTSL